MGASSANFAVVLRPGILAARQPNSANQFVGPQAGLPALLRFRAILAASRCSGTCDAEVCRLRAAPSDRFLQRMASILRARGPCTSAPKTDRAELRAHTRGRKTSRSRLRVLPGSAASLDDGLEDFRVASAAAEISGEPFAYFQFGGLRVSREQIHGGENHAGRADAALRSAVRQKRLLDGVQAIGTGNSFDRADFCALGLEGRHETTVDQCAVDFNRSSATLAFAAAFFRAGEAGLLA